MNLFVEVARSEVQRFFHSRTESWVSLQLCINDLAHFVPYYLPLFPHDCGESTHAGFVRFDQLVETGKETKCLGSLFGTPKKLAERRHDGVRKVGVIEQGEVIAEGTGEN